MLSAAQFRAAIALFFHVCPGYCHKVSVGRWSSGMILASGARGRGFNSRTAPVQFFAVLVDFFLILTLGLKAELQQPKHGCIAQR